MSKTQEFARPAVDHSWKNDKFRKGPWTGDKTQPGLMAVRDGGKTGAGVHEGRDRLLTFIAGIGGARTGWSLRKVVNGGVSTAAPDSFHSVLRTRSRMVRLFATDSFVERKPGAEYVIYAGIGA
ncbi:MAG: hypothetical protein Q7J57_18400 [Gemmobacter sp.]|nr:hypothetical protein [Gemmobacter sp.]